LQQGELVAGAPEDLQEMCRSILNRSCYSVDRGPSSALRASFGTKTKIRYCVPVVARVR
jgi:hypothetical protein